MLLNTYKYHHTETLFCLCPCLDLGLSVSYTDTDTYVLLLIFKNMYYFWMITWVKTQNNFEITKVQPHDVA